MAAKNVLFATESDQVNGFDDNSETAAVEIETEKYLIFDSDHLLFGVRAQSVVEILTHHVITPLPMVPGYVSGIINLRGAIIPIIDIRVLMGKPVHEDSCIIVLSIEGIQLGILVDTVVQMVDIAGGDLLPVPARNSQKLVSGMCSLPDGGGTMLVLDCDLLLHGEG